MAITGIDERCQKTAICFADVKSSDVNSFQVRWIVKRCQLKSCVIFLLPFINMHWIRETSSTMNDTMSHNIYILRTIDHTCVLSINNAAIFSNPILWFE
jgi:hypothetical protein